MRNSLLCVILFIYYGAVAGFAQGVLPIDSVASSLNREMQNGNMEQASIYTYEIINRNESVSNATLLNCADCLIAKGDYKGCISFCDKWKEMHADDSDFFPELFDAPYGECYYFLGDEILAGKYLSAYYNRAKENGHRVGAYYLGILASCLHQKYEFAKADTVYTQYLNTILQSENLTIDKVSNSEYKILLSYKLYEWAYNSMFQGDEKSGLGLLRMSADCGNEEAWADYQILSKSPTFAKEFEFKKSMIREFEKYISQLGTRQLTFGMQNSFWHDVQNTNEDYKKLQAVLDKSKQPSTLKKALSEMETNRYFVETKLKEFQPYQANDFEKSLENQLCGNQTFLKELRVYPAVSPNAFATPFGQVYLTDGLVMLYHFNKNLLIGICAHEATHFLCQHSLIGLWKQNKKEQRNKIWTGILVGLNTAIQTGAAVCAATSGVEYSQDYWDNWAESVSGVNNSFIQAFKEDAFYFQFKYARQQEIEADLMAYRFCESIGLGGYAYIIALELLGNRQGYIKPDKTSDHPTNTYRIGLLKHLYSLEHNVAQ